MKAYLHTKFKSENKNALMANMEMCDHIALYGEVHTIGEKLVKPCATDLAACVIDEEAARKIQFMPLSNNTIQRRIRIVHQMCWMNRLED
jgi:hypothetical protein